MKREEENKYKKLLDNISVGVCQTDYKGNFIEANKALARMFGFKSVEEFKSANTKDLYYNINYRVTKLNKLRKLDKLEDQEILLKRKNGRPFWCLLSFVNTRDANGNLIINTIVKDISILKKRELALARKEENYRNVVETATDFTYIFDRNDAVVLLNAKNNVIIEANKQAQNILGRNRKLLVGKDFCAFFPRGRYNECKKNILKGKKNLEFEAEIVKKEGVIIYVKFNIMLLTMHNKRYLLCTMQDITEKTWAMNALRKSERRYRILVENIAEGIVVINSTGGIEFINQAFGKMVGYKRVDIIGKKVSDLLQKRSQRVLKDYLEQCAKGIKDDTECVFSHKNGKSIIVRISAAMGESNKFILGVMNICKQKGYENKLQIYQERLREMVHELLIAESREKHKVVNVLHDNVIQNMAIAKIKLQGVQLICANTPAKASIAQVVELIDDSLRFTRTLSSNLYPPLLFEIGLEAALEAMIEKIKEQHKINIELITGHYPANLNNDIKVLLYEVVRELLVNTIKHAKADKVLIKIKKDAENINIYVCDNGIGFSVLKQTSLPNKKEHFGLFSVKERLEFAGGKFLLESAKGSGTKAYIVAPIKK